MPLPGNLVTRCRKLARSLVPVLLVAAIAGCGSSPSGSGSGGNFPSVTGNWQFALKVTLPTPPAVPTNPIVLLSGSLSSSGNSVTGILRAEGLALPPCNSPTADLIASGKVDASGNVTVSVPIAGGVATLAFNAPPATVPLAIGTYQVVGGPCAQSSIAMNAIEVPNVSGTYKGTMTQLVPVPSGTAPTEGVTSELVEASTPNSDGQFPLTGTITATGACPTTLSITQGVVAGIQIQSNPSPPLLFPPLPPGPSFTGGASLSSQPRTIFGSLFQPTGCAGVLYAGQLDFQ